MARTVLRITSEFMIYQCAADTTSEVRSDPPPTGWGIEGKALESPDVAPGGHISGPPPYRGAENPSKPGEPIQTWRAGVLPYPRPHL